MYAFQSWRQDHQSPTQMNVPDGNKIVSPGETNIANVAAKVSPSVVSILTSARAATFGGLQQTEEGAGTGIIVGKDGYVMTNNHVIDSADTVSVVTADGTTYDNVKVIGRDPLNDVAFIKIAGVNNLPAAEIGDSSSIRIGQDVVAIGNALGQYQNTVTSGIISGTGRPVSAQAGNNVESLTDLLQTDAAINSGNSGGPLVNMAGQVIGINTAVATNANGIGFAIPINSTKGVLKGVLENGKVSRAYLGVNYVAITPEVAKTYKLSVMKGAYVVAPQSGPAIVAGSPADKAGVKEKDIITKVNGIEVGDHGGVSSIIGQYGPGETVQLTVLRGGQTLTISITLGSYSS
jgi:serine protease Do